MLKSLPSTCLHSNQVQFIIAVFTRSPGINTQKLSATVQQSLLKNAKLTPFIYIFG
jgi:hypothetical protein